MIYRRNYQGLPTLFSLLQHLHLSSVLLVDEHEPEPGLTSLKVLNGLVDIVKLVLLNPSLEVVVDSQLEHAGNLSGGTASGTRDDLSTVDEVGSRDAQGLGDDTEEDQVTEGTEEGHVWADIELVGVCEGKG